MIKFLVSVDDLKINSSVTLYGAGGVGSYYCRELRNKRPDIKVICFIDDLKSGKYEGLDVLSFSQYLKRDRADTVLVTTSFWKEIADKLQSELIENFLIADPAHEDQPKHQDVVVRGTMLRSYIGSNALKLVTQNFEQTEPGTLDWIDGFEAGAVYYDIGASNGLFALYAAIRRKAICIAFEPDAQNFSSLEMNHFLNKDLITEPIISLNIALSDKTGLERISILNYCAGSHGKIIESARDRSRQVVNNDHIQYVVVEPLDQVIDRYNLPIPNYLKIDVDGAESLVLSGASKTLANPKLKSILLEINEPQKAGSNLVEMVRNYGFELRDIQDINEFVGTPVDHVKNCLFYRN